jgi:carboxypeptidase D
MSASSTLHERPAHALARGFVASLVAACAFASLFASSGAEARMLERSAARHAARQAAAARVHAGPHPRAPVSSGVKNITFHNPKASRAYRLDFGLAHVSPALQSSTSTGLRSLRSAGTWVPAGPVSCRSATRLERRGRFVPPISLTWAYMLTSCEQLFFWFFPPGPQGSTDDLIFWYGHTYTLLASELTSLHLVRTNGGPGCSSLEGLLQENGVGLPLGEPTTTLTVWT